MYNPYILSTPTLQQLLFFYQICIQVAFSIKSFTSTFGPHQYEFVTFLPTGFPLLRPLENLNYIQLLLKYTTLSFLQNDICYWRRIGKSAVEFVAVDRLLEAFFRKISLNHWHLTAFPCFSTVIALSRCQMPREYEKSYENRLLTTEQILLFDAFS